MYTFGYRIVLQKSTAAKCLAFTPTPEIPAKRSLAQSSNFNSTSSLPTSEVATGKTIPLAGNADKVDKDNVLL